MLSLKGIFPPLPTAFDKDENLAPMQMQENIRKLSHYGLSGFLVLGSNGELVMLNRKEQETVFRACREAIPSGSLMLAGTGGESTRETIEQTRMAGRAGADAALVLNPFYYKEQMTPKALKAHFWAVAEAAEIPVIIYNMPSNTGLDMDAATILSIGEHPNIVGVKDSGGNVVKLGELVSGASPGFQVLAGSAGFLLPALSMGAVGGILALANIAPAQCLEIFQGFRDGNFDGARKMQHRMIAINAAVTRRWGVPALKAAMDHLGLYGGPARSPLQPLEEPVHTQLITLLQKSLEEN
jgi:4-hydroxy-2-oxoglutarate aldolase